MGCKLSLVKEHPASTSAGSSRAPSSLRRGRGGGSGAATVDPAPAAGVSAKPTNGSSALTSSDALSRTPASQRASESFDATSTLHGRTDSVAGRGSSYASLPARPTNHQRPREGSAGDGADEGPWVGHFDPIPLPPPVGATASHPTSGPPFTLSAAVPPSPPEPPVHRTSLSEHTATDAAQAAQEYQAHVQAKKNAEEAKTARLQLEMFDPIRPVDSFNVTHRALLGRCWDRRVPEVGAVSFVHAALAMAAEAGEPESGAGRSLASLEEANTLFETFSAVPPVPGTSQMRRRNTSFTSQSCEPGGRSGGGGGNGRSAAADMGGSFTNGSIFSVPGIPPHAIGAGGVPRRSHWFSVCGISAWVATPTSSPTGRPGVAKEAVGSAYVPRSPTTLGHSTGVRDGPPRDAPTLGPAVPTAAAVQAYQEAVHMYPTLPTMDDATSLPLAERVELANKLMVWNPRFHGIKNSYAFRVSEEDPSAEELADPGIHFLLRQGLCPARGVKVVQWNRVEFFSPNFATLTKAVAKTEGIAHLSTLSGRAEATGPLGVASAQSRHMALHARNSTNLSFLGQYIISSGENMSVAGTAGDALAGRGAGSSHKDTTSNSAGGPREHHVPPLNGSLLHQSLLGPATDSHSRGEGDGMWGTAPHSGSLTRRASRFPEDSVLCLALEVPLSRLATLPGVPAAVRRRLNGRGSGPDGSGSSPARSTPAGSVAGFPSAEEVRRHGGHASPLSEGNVSSGHGDGIRAGVRASSPGAGKDPGSSHLVGLVVGSFSVAMDPFRWEQNRYTRFPVDVDGYKSSSRRDYGEGIVTDILYGGIMVVECSSAEAGQHLLDLLKAMRWTDEHATVDILGDVKKRFRQYREAVAKHRRGTSAAAGRDKSSVAPTTPSSSSPAAADTPARTGLPANVDTFQYRISHRVGGKPMRDRVELKQISVFMGDTVVEQAQTISVPLAGGGAQIHGGGSGHPPDSPPQVDPDSTPSFSRVASAWVSLPAISAVLRTWCMHLLDNPQYAQPCSFFLQRFSGLAPVLQHTTISNLFHMGGTPTEKTGSDADEEGIDFFESDLAGYRGETAEAVTPIRRISRFNRFYASRPVSEKASPAEHGHELVKSASRETLALCERHSSADSKGTPEQRPAAGLMTFPDGLALPGRTTRTGRGTGGAGAGAGGGGVSPRRSLVAATAADERRRAAAAAAAAATRDDNDWMGDHRPLSTSTAPPSARESLDEDAATENPLGAHPHHGPLDSDSLGSLTTGDGTSGLPSQADSGLATPVARRSGTSSVDTRRVAVTRRPSGVPSVARGGAGDAQGDGAGAGAPSRRPRTRRPTAVGDAARASMVDDAAAVEGVLKTKRRTSAKPPKTAEAAARTKPTAKTKKARRQTSRRLTAIAADTEASREEAHSGGSLDGTGTGAHPSTATLASSSFSREPYTLGNTLPGQELEELWRIAELEVRAQAQELAELVRERQHAEDAHRDLLDELHTLQRAFLPHCAVQELDLLFLYLKTALFEPEDLPHSRVFLSHADWLPVLTALWTSPANATRCVEIAHPLTSHDLPKVGMLAGLLYHRYAAAPLEQLEMDASGLLGSRSGLLTTTTQVGSPRGGGSFGGGRAAYDEGARGASDTADREETKKTSGKGRRRRPPFLRFLSGSRGAAGRGRGRRESTPLVDDGDEEEDAAPLVFSGSSAGAFPNAFTGGRVPFYVSPEQARDTLWLLLRAIAANTRCVRFQLCLRGFPTLLPLKEREQLQRREDEENTRALASVAGAAHEGGRASKDSAAAAPAVKKRSSVANFFGIGKRSLHTEAHLAIGAGGQGGRASMLHMCTFLANSSLVGAESGLHELLPARTFSTLPLTPGPSRGGSLVLSDASEPTFGTATAASRAHPYNQRRSSGIEGPLSDASVSALTTSAASVVAATAGARAADGAQGLAPQAHRLVRPFYTLLFHACAALPVDVLAGEQGAQAQRIAAGWAENGAAGALAALASAGYVANPRISHYHHDYTMQHNNPLFYIPPTRQRKLAELALEACAVDCTTVDSPLAPVEPHPASACAPVSLVGAGEELPSSWGMDARCLTHGTVFGLQSQEEELAVLAEEDARLLRHADEIWAVLRALTHGFNRPAVERRPSEKGGEGGAGGPLDPARAGGGRRSTLASGAAGDDSGEWRRRVILLHR